MGLDFGRDGGGREVGDKRREIGLVHRIHARGHGRGHGRGRVGAHDRRGQMWQRMGRGAGAFHRGERWRGVLALTLGGQILRRKPPLGGTDGLTRRAAHAIRRTEQRGEQARRGVGTVGSRRVGGRQGGGRVRHSLGRGIVAAQRSEDGGELALILVKEGRGGGKHRGTDSFGRGGGRGDIGAHVDHGRLLLGDGAQREVVGHVLEGRRRGNLGRGDIGTHIDHGRQVLSEVADAWVVRHVIKGRRRAFGGHGGGIDVRAEGVPGLSQQLLGGFVRGRQHDSAFEAGQRLLTKPGLQQQVASQRECLRVVRRQSCGGPQELDGLFRASRLEAGPGAQDVSGDRVRVGGQPLSANLDGVFAVAAVDEELGQVEKDEVAGIGLKGLFVALDQLGRHARTSLFSGA